MDIKIKKLNPMAVLPTKAHDNDAAYDLFSISDGKIKVIEAKVDDKNVWRVLYIEYPIGIAVEPPKGYHIEIVARSSVSNTDLILANCLAVGDEGYRGEYKLRFKIPPMSNMTVSAETESEAISIFDGGMASMGVIKFSKGDKIAQMLIRKTESMNIVEEIDLSDTQRGEGGFGSTGK